MAWYNESWTKRVKVTIDHTKVSATLYDFPVYIDLSKLPADFHANCNQTDARDIRVTTSDEVTEVPREVVFYDSITDTGELHFKAPSLSSTTDTDFYIYYGNLGATEPAVDATYGRNNVWTSDYKVVLHLNEASGGAIESVGLNTATFNGDLPTAITATVGSGQDFDGNGDYIALTNSTNLDCTNQTVSFWLKADSFATTNRAFWARRSSTTNGQLIFNYTTSTGTINWDTAGSTKRWNTGYKAPTDGTVVWLTFTFDGSVKRLYVDGKPTANSAPDTHSLLNPSCNAHVGADTNTTAMFIDGYMDEFRLSAAARSAQWISTEYNNQSSPSTFSTIGTAESVPSGTSADSERGLYIQGKSSTNSTRGLYITGSHTLSTDYFNVEFGLAEAGGSERGLYLTGSSSGNSERSLYLTGSLDGSSERSLYLGVVNTSDSERALYLETIGYGSSEVAMYLSGVLGGSSERNLYLQGKTTDSSERALYTEVVNTGSSSRNMYVPVDGGNYSDRFMYLSGKDTGSSERGLYATGGYDDSSERSLYLEVVSTGTSERPLYVGVVDTDSGERSLYLIGSIDGSGERSLYLGVVDMGSSERSLYLTGSLPGESERSLYLGVVGTGSSERGLYIGVVNEGASERSLYITGSLDDDSERSLYLNVKGASSSDRNLYLTGSTTDSSERSLYLDVVNTGDSQRGLYITGCLSDNSERTLYLSVNQVGSSERGMWLHGGMVGDAEVYFWDGMSWVEITALTVYT